MDFLLKRLDEASYDRDIDKLKQLLEEDPLLLDKVLTEVRDNPLHIAALQGDANFTTEVVKLKPELARKLNREGRLALHLAAARGHLQVSEILVDKVGSDICLIRESNHGYMPVHIAMVNGNHDIVRMLIERCNETLEKVTNKTESLLHLAVKAKCLDSVCYLIDQGLKLNEKDDNGNTCLHLALAKPNNQVIRHLLDQEGIEINLTNAMGLTPLDVLLVSSLCSDVNISLVDTIRRTGGVRAIELSDLESNMSSSFVVSAPAPSNQRLSRGIKNRAREKRSDSQTLLIVATLVATMTFQAISNPPGGFIQLSFEKVDNFDSSWLQFWTYSMYPAGRPVLFWQLQSFFILDSLALFSSVSVILWLLIAEPKTKIMMKFLVAIVWFAAFCTALAFGSAFYVTFVPYSFGALDNSKGTYLNRYDWVFGFLAAWFFFYVTAGCWATGLIIAFLWQKAGFKMPKWIAKLLRWLKGITSWFRRIVPVVLMACVIAAFCLATYGIYNYLIMH